MKIGIALYHINPQVTKGVTVYALNVVEAFGKIDKKNKYFLLIRPENAESFQKYAVDNFEIVAIKSFGNKVRRKISYFLQNYVLIFPALNILYEISDKFFNNDLVCEVDSLKLDALYFPSGALFPISLKTKSVVSIHDIQYDHFPNFFSLFERLGRKEAHKASVKKARYIQASSRFVGQDFIRYFKCNPEKVVLVRDGVDNAFNPIPLNHEQTINLREKYNLPEKFLFYPAQHWLHKNHITVLKAIRKLKEDGKEIHLVLTGSAKSSSVNLKKEAEKLYIQNQVVFVGNVSFKDLVNLYKIADIVCVASLHESNSLPLIEALASGTATLASDIEPNIEINSNNAITIFEQLNPLDLAEKINKLFYNDELKKENVIKGFELAKNYSWENTAKNYILLFEKIVKM